MLIRRAAVVLAWSGRPGQSPTRGSHGSGRARLTHPAPQIRDSLHDDSWSGRRWLRGADNVPTDADPGASGKGGQGSLRHAEPAAVGGVAGVLAPAATARTVPLSESPTGQSAVADGSLSRITDSSPSLPRP